MAILTKSILILEDGKISAFDFQNKETYIQPEIIVNTLDAISQITIQGQFKETINVDITIQTINGVAFVGNFAQLETALRLAAKESNGLAVGGVGGGGGGGDANQPTQQRITAFPITFSSWKRLDFIASGAVVATIDGQAITFPEVFNFGTVAGTTYFADSVSTNSVTFSGSGVLLVTIQK